MTKKKLLFVINPIAGNGKQNSLPKLISSTIENQKFDYELVFTKTKGELVGIAKEAAKEGFDAVIIAGGDGTVNEAGQSLLNTDTALGIIPTGSGNGLARHLNIPMNPKKALQMINRFSISDIDVGTVNGHPFFCTSGVGFDAHIADKFAKAPTRGFNTYVKTTFREYFGYSPVHYKFWVDEKEMEMKAFMITVANASQYGNNAYISPLADIRDGKLDVCILEPFAHYDIMNIAIRLFNKTLPSCRYFSLYQNNELVITREKEGPVHFDGEPGFMGKELHYNILPLAIRVIC